MLNQVSPERMTYVTFQPKTSEPEVWQNKQIGTAAGVFRIEERDGFYERLLNKNDYEPRGKEIFGSWKLY